MANTVTGLLAVLYEQGQQVARELVGCAKAVKQDFNGSRAAKDQTVRVPISPTQEEGDYTPAQTTTIGSNRVFAYVDVVMDQSKETSFHLTGEEKIAFDNGGSIAADTFVQSVGQGMRTLTNALEGRLHGELYKNASRALGTAGVTPFASDFHLVAGLRKEMDDNGAPRMGRSLVIDTSAGYNLRKNAILLGNNTAGTTQTLREGELLNLHGFSIMESAGITEHTKGTGTSYVVDGTGVLTKGNVSIKAKTGTGTIVAGDVIALESDDARYMVNTGITAAGTFVIGKPGLLEATANNKTITIGDDYIPNVAVQRDAAVLVTRAPAIPDSPLIKQYPITDPVSGLSFLLCEIVGDGLITYRLQMLYGYRVLQREFIQVLMG